jgi:hypothetical protein
MEGKGWQEAYTKTNLCLTGIQRRVVRWNSMDVSEEHVSSIFKVEDGGVMFLRNVRSLWMDYAKLHHNHSCNTIIITTSSSAYSG